MRAEEFLQNYRILEELLGSKYSGAPRRHATVVAEYLNDPESAPFSEALTLCREVRNLLTHNADQDGQFVIEPSEGTLRSLLQIIEYVKLPKSALSIATPVEKLMSAQPQERALPLMRAMSERGYSHVPVLQGAHLQGVFSVSTLFQFMLRRPRFVLDESTRVSAFSAILPVREHPGERFLFVHPETSCFDLKREFERPAERNRRLSAIFVMENGQSTGKLLGMITPWDMLGKSAFASIARVQ